MNKETILSTLKELKPKYAREGFEIVGLFGSYARDDASSQSDIDICYALDKKFVEKYHGFDAIARLESLKKELKLVFNTEIDFATIDTHNRVMQQTLKEEMIYVS